MLNRNLPPVDGSRFAMVPRSDVPRSTFSTRHRRLMAFDGGYLVPFHVDEVLPGDHHRAKVTIFARLNNLIFPVMDDVQLETFFFFVPNRLVWANWVKMMGERSPLISSSINYTVPQVVSAVGGFPVNSLFDYFDLPTVGQVDPTKQVSVNVLPLRAYQLIWDEWFRDENLQDKIFPSVGDGPDAVGNFSLVRRNKKHDYFTSCLPYPQKGSADVSVPLLGFATVVPSGGAGSHNQPTFWNSSAGTSAGFLERTAAGAHTAVAVSAAGNAVQEVLGWDSPALKADLSTAQGGSLNAIRLAVASQQFLEKDARGGTRYTELLVNHFGVRNEDARLQRPEYIGGGRSDFRTQAIPQTSSTGITGSTSPQGALSGQATVTGQHEFSLYATEHGYIIGLVHVTADLTYSQGLHRMWTRSTRFDFYWPTFANLGEQAVRNDEIYCRGDANDPLVFGYQERWAEYRHYPSRITGVFRPTSTGNIAAWHLSLQFGSLPVLGNSFLQDTPPFSRVLAAGAAANNQQILLDSIFDLKRTRAMPIYSVPGLKRF